jgi:hypothetical protein
MEGVNRALINPANQIDRILESISDSSVPCIFISYQREDEEYASEIADYIISNQIDVYIDLNDNDLRMHNQTDNPGAVTDSIRKGLNKSDYMLIIVSPSTFKSHWVPFEIGYAFDDKGEKMKLLRHKGISKNTLPSYLKVKGMINGVTSLNNFIRSVRKQYNLYEHMSKAGRIRSFSDYVSNPLKQYLDNE